MTDLLVSPHPFAGGNPYFSGLANVVSAVYAACSAVSSVAIRISIILARSPLTTAASQAAIWPEITSLSLTVIPA